MADYFGAPEHLRSAGFAARNQQRCDEIQAEFRSNPSGRPSIRREAPPLSAAQMPTDDELNLRLAEELDYARRMLDSMGDSLSGDPAVLMRHSVSLQSVDIIGQLLGHIARVIRSSDPAAAVEQVGMCELKARLTRQSID